MRLSTGILIVAEDVSIIIDLINCQVYLLYFLWGLGWGTLGGLFGWFSKFVGVFKRFDMISVYAI